MVKGKGKGKKKQSKAAAVISSDSEVSLGEVDFPNLPPNQALNVPQGEQEEQEEQREPEKKITQIHCQKTDLCQWQIIS